MRRSFFVYFLIAVLISCNIRNNDHTIGLAAAGQQVFKDSTSIQLIDSSYNFGKVTDGEKVEYNYKFRNTGKHPLIISSARASCGCTVPEKPDAPIQPGEVGFLKVVFDSRGRVGDVHKDIYVVSNAFPAFPTLALTGEVVSANK